VATGPHSPDFLAPKPSTYTKLNVRGVKRKPRHDEVEAPAGAPDVVIVLIDDMGFGVPSTFCGRRVVARFTKEGLVTWHSVEATMKLRKT
jgi:hypothetical protein